MNSDSNNSTRLWVASEVYYPEEISTGYYLTSIAEGLAQDHETKVICGQPNYGARGIKAPKHEVHNGVEIFRAASTLLDKNVIPFRAINMQTLGISVFFVALRRFRKGDRVLVVTAPPSLPFIIALAALIRGTGYTLLLHDCYPELLVATGKLKKNSIGVRAINYFNRWLYKHAEKMIVVGRDMREMMLRKTAGLDIPISTIPNWADLETIHPCPKSENGLLKSLGLRDKFVLMYAGNIGHPTDVESIIKCAERLLDRPEFHFLFIGSGAKRPYIERQIASRNLKNVTYLGTKPRSEQVEFLNACDVALISLISGTWGTAMPSRTYNILAAGKPILALTDETSELALVIDEEDVGLHIIPGSPDKLFDAILELYENRAGLSEMGKRAYIAAQLKYSRAAATDRYRAEFGGAKQ
ncbi:MAG TPA: glycosyltransferase family 4 protein [Pyrinomonadaceae bacterium]|nr:glycosyltransferase family 4 protein [Pyrinomonadaceae bacterium]